MKEEQTHRHTYGKAWIGWGVFALVEHTRYAEAMNFGVFIMHRTEGKVS